MCCPLAAHASELDGINVRLGRNQAICKATTGTVGVGRASASLSDARVSSAQVTAVGYSTDMTEIYIPADPHCRTLFCPMVLYREVKQTEDNISGIFNRAIDYIIRTSI